MLEQYNVILGSGSPRRKELLAGLDLHFDVLVRKGVCEDYPQELEPEKVAQYIAEEKMSAYTDLIKDNTLVKLQIPLLYVELRFSGNPKTSVMQSVCSGS